MSLRYALLAELVGRPGTARDLYHRLQDPVGSWWEISDGAVRLSLQDAEKKVGLVRLDTDELGREMYSITELRRTDLESWMKDVTVRPEPVRDEWLTRMFSSGHQPSEAVREIWSQLRAESEEPDSAHPTRAPHRGGGPYDSP